MSKEKIIYLPLGILTIATAVSGAILMAEGTGAATETANASVTVSAACTLSGVVDAGHTATMMNGIYQDNIGTTTLTANCNDANGYAIYAIGYSDDTYGNTNMIGATSGKTFATGTATTGDLSAWAMKVTSKDTTGPAIQNGFDSYSLVPAEYTMVASQSGATDVTAGSSVTTTYGVYISGSQAADTYTGQVQYSLVHPGTAEAPSEVTE